MIRNLPYIYLGLDMIHERSQCVSDRNQHKVVLSILTFDSTFQTLRIFDFSIERAYSGILKLPHEPNTAIVVNA